MMRDRTYYAMKNYPEMLTSTLEVAASTVPAEYILPKLIHEFTQQYPQVLFSMRETDSAGDPPGLDGRGDAGLYRHHHG